MRGSRKAHTKILLDRNRVLPFYISPKQKEIYDRDDYKYLIHLLKLFPTDEFHVTQYLLLKFHPLIINVCRKFYSKKINLDWLDLISFARYSFVELVLRFPLNSTLFFKVFMPIALDRAVNDFLLYDTRRRSLRNALRLDNLQTQDRDSLFEEHNTVLNKNNREVEDHGSHIEEYRTECIEFIKRHKKFSALDKQLFLENFVKNKALVQICKDRNLDIEVVHPKMDEMLMDIKDHIRTKFL